jgi:hypothetical protein
MYSRCRGLAADRQPNQAGSHVSYDRMIATFESSSFSELLFGGQESLRVSALTAAQRGVVQTRGPLCMLTFLSQTGRLQAEVVQEHRVIVRGHRVVKAGPAGASIPRGPRLVHF